MGVSNVPDKRKRQTLMFSTRISSERKLAAMDYLRRDFLFLTVSSVSGEEHTKITEHVDLLKPDEESQLELSEYESCWGNSVSPPEVNLEQAINNLTSNFVIINKENMSQLLTSCESFQEKLDEINYWQD